MTNIDAAPATTGSATTESPTHEGVVDIGAETHAGAPAPLGGLHAQFVRYPGCQQLQIWLPQASHLGYTDLLISHADGGVMAQGGVRDHCNGSVQLLFDTLAWPPGDYRVEVHHAQGWQHTLALHKRAPGEVAALDADADVDPDPSHGAEQAGRLDPRAELDALAAMVEAGEQADLVAQAAQDRQDKQDALDVAAQRRRQLDAGIAQRLAAAFASAKACRLEYSGNYRGGTITYIEGNLRIAFPHEMGGGACKFYIELPTPAQWARATDTALSRRDEIVRFVAETVRAEQASGWRYEIHDDVIRFV